MKIKPKETGEQKKPNPKAKRRDNQLIRIELRIWHLRRRLARHVNFLSVTKRHRDAKRQLEEEYRGHVIACNASTNHSLNSTLHQSAGLGSKFLQT